jgi:hypothetical protein
VSSDPTLFEWFRSLGFAILFYRLLDDWRTAQRYKGSLFKILLVEWTAGAPPKPGVNAVLVELVEAGQGADSIAGRQIIDTDNALVVEGFG